MSISPFFHELRSAYQAEINDLTFDSEGRDVLRQHLAARRKELGFLLQMMELSPEMVAVIFHQGFEFKKPAVMDHLLGQESDELPEWASLADAIVLPPWAQALAKVVLKEPMGEWFLTVAAGLEYMYSKPDGTSAAMGDSEDGGDSADGQDGAEGDGGRNASANSGDDRADPVDGPEGDDERDARQREEAGADWLAEQGFDRKDR
jgi:hypothetical protein